MNELMNQRMSDRANEATKERLRCGDASDDHGIDDYVDGDVYSGGSVAHAHHSDINTTEFLQ